MRVIASVVIMLCLPTVAQADATQLLFKCAADMKKETYREKYSKVQDYEHPLCSNDGDTPIGRYSILLDTSDDSNLYAEVEYVSCVKKSFSAHQEYSVKANKVEKDPTSYNIQVYNPVARSMWTHALSRTTPPTYRDVQWSYTCDMERVEVEQPAF